MLKPFELSYTNINLLVFLVIIPIVWASILDRKLHAKWRFKIIFSGVILMLGILHFFGTINLFQAGVNFCEKMMHVHNSTYAESCVIYCVLLPLVVTIVLVSLPMKKVQKIRR
ncbi:MAG: hypothetical protein ABI204_14220 [Ginsengibacter sp.]